MYIVYTANGENKFVSKGDAERWLDMNGFVRRPRQAGEYVRDTNGWATFASLRPANHLEVQVAKSAMAKAAIEG
jgi:hypothetical protein